jgi:c-di-GMP-binding flagellar brake protein YcgR
MDVFIPVLYTMPEDQQLTSVEGIWKARRMMCEFIEPPKVMASEGSFRVLEWNDGPQIEPCRINLSGGGVRIKSPEPFPSGALLNVNLFLPLSSIKIIDAVVSVIRSTEIRLTLDNNPAYTVATKFVFLTERDRESIITYIFNEQRNSLSMQF